jgi:hypothetical protein
MPTVRRPQFDPSVVWTVNAVSGRWPLTAGVETVTPDGKYILANSWPKPKANGFSATPRNPGRSDFSPLTAAAAPEGPKSSLGARAVWPNLP